MMKGALPAIALFLVSACFAQAGTVTWGSATVPTIEIPVTDIPVLQIAFTDVAGNAIRLVDLRMMNTDIQAKSVGVMLDRWLQLYGLLQTPAVYRGNYFAVNAAAIKKRAAKEGVSDAVLAECSKFAEELSTVKAKRTK